LHQSPPRGLSTAYTNIIQEFGNLKNYADVAARSKATCLSFPYVPPSAEWSELV